MANQTKFSPEVRERAVRLVQEHRSEYPSLWAAVGSIAPKIGCTPTTLLDWVKRREIDSGVRPGVTSEEAYCPLHGRALDAAHGYPKTPVPGHYPPSTIPVGNSVQSPCSLSQQPALTRLWHPLADFLLS